MSFNVLDDAWIPVKFKGASPTKELGIRQVLLKANEIIEVATDNPLETLSINRLILGFVASAFPELSELEVWIRCWEREKFDEPKLNSYLEKFSDRFDLFSATRPFYQHPNTEAKEYSPLTRLLLAASSGNNATLFSHDMDGLPCPMTPAEAARAIVSTQTTSLGGGVAKPFNLSHAPMVAGAMFWLRGTVKGKSSLFYALLMNLPPTEEVWGNNPADDFSAWEPESPPIPQKRDAKGLRDLLTFQSRRLLLRKNENDEVDGVKYNQGSKLEALPFHDPHMTYREGKKDVLPLRLSVDKALWRDSSIYLTFRSSDKASHAPRTFEWISQPEVKDHLGITDHDVFQADVFGMISDKAKMEMWRRERVIVYPEIINNYDRWSLLENLIEIANKQERRLKDSTKAFASRLRFNKPLNTRLGDIERRERDDFVKSLSVENRYWPNLGVVFPNTLAKVAHSPLTHLEEIKESWVRETFNISQKALQSGLEPFAQDARSWQALAEAEIVLKLGFLPSKNKSTKTK